MPAAWLLATALLARAGSEPGGEAPTAPAPAETPAAGSADRAALAGRWVLDAERSDPPDTLLEARGAPWIVRQAAALGNRTMDIRVDGETVTVAVSAGPLSLSETLVADGRFRPVKTPKGDTATARHAWEDGALVSTVGLALADGRPATVLTRREARGDTLVVETTLSDEHGVLAATREVWRRAE